MKISIPTLPLSSSNAPLNPLAKLTTSEAASHVATFLQKGKGKTMILTGAGISVDSGIRAYRGPEGHYTTNPNYRPIFYGELVAQTEQGTSFRKRYWSRGYLGWPPVRDAQPNPTHYRIEALRWLGLVGGLITQNVDGLHVKASPYSNEEKRKILELHGTLHWVHCKHGHLIPREDFQSTLSQLNPSWLNFAEEAARTGTEPRTNPDGDVDLRGVSYDSFQVPSCSRCEEELGLEGEILKPSVIFFGESIPTETKEMSVKMVEEASQLLVMGTSLATYSAFRLIKQAVEAEKPVLMLSLGPSRADALIDSGAVSKIEQHAGDVLKEVLAKLSKGMESDKTLQRLLSSGVIKAPDQRKVDEAGEPIMNRYARPEGSDKTLEVASGVTSVTE